MRQWAVKLVELLWKFEMPLCVFLILLNAIHTITIYNIIRRGVAVSPAFISINNALAVPNSAILHSSLFPCIETSCFGGLIIIIYDPCRQSACRSVVSSPSLPGFLLPSQNLIDAQCRSSLPFRQLTDARCPPSASSTRLLSAYWKNSLLFVLYIPFSSTSSCVPSSLSLLFHGMVTDHHGQHCRFHVDVCRL